MTPAGPPPPAGVIRFKTIKKSLDFHELQLCGYASDEIPTTRMLQQ
jgi:hypothetical protein